MPRTPWQRLGMWRDSLLGGNKNNRSFGLSVRVSALISAMLLSLLCGLLYNAWKYEVERIEMEEGGWHSRLVGEIGKEDLEVINNFANVKEAIVNEEGKGGEEPSLDLYFSHIGAVFSDTPKIAELAGVPPEKAVYHYGLLAMYLVRDSGDAAPRLIFPLFLLITLTASFSLVAIIHNSFAVSMDAKVHQLGVFASVGATPRQVRACLLQEAAALCAMPVMVGNLLGIAAGMGLLQMVNTLLGKGVVGRHKAVYGCHPVVLALTLLATILTIWISAWLPARRLSRMTPLEAIKNTGELQLRRRKSSHFLKLLFGVEGELAGNALKAQGKALRTASLSLILSLLAFTAMQCFFVMSGISTRETFFERYQGVWDVMATVHGAEVDAFGQTEAVQALAGVESAIVYQKAAAKRVVMEEELSEAMKSFGGFSHASGRYVTQADGGWLVNAPVIILDDSSFLAYCEQVGIAPRLDGAVILNQIRDVTNPDFRHLDFMPYIKEQPPGENAVTVLRQSGNEEMAAQVPVLAYAEKAPSLREEYAKLDYYELAHFVPASLWKEIKGQIGGMEEDCRICVLGREEATLEELSLLQKEIDQLVGGEYAVEYENRIQQYEANNKQVQGSKAIFGGFCILLAAIGVGNVFSNTLGFARQRKREFARYMSVGLTPGGIRKMLCIEALALAGRPILVALPLAAMAVGFMLKLSYLEVEVFMAEAPLAPIFAFLLAISGSVALAYGLAWRDVSKISLSQVLRDDTMI